MHLLNQLLSSSMILLTFFLLDMSDSERYAKVSYSFIQHFITVNSFYFTFLNYHVVNAWYQHMIDVCVYLNLLISSSWIVIFTVTRGHSLSFMVLITHLVTHPFLLSFIYICLIAFVHPFIFNLFVIAGFYLCVICLDTKSYVSVANQPWHFGDFFKKCILGCKSN